MKSARSETLTLGKMLISYPSEGYRLRSLAYLSEGDHGNAHSAGPGNTDYSVFTYTVGWTSAAISFAALVVM